MLDIDTTILHQTGFWPVAICIACWLSLFARTSKSLLITAVLALPGTAAHELAHILAGLVTFARPRGINLWPRREGQGFVLGEASFGAIGLINGALVALAPLLLLPGAAWAFLSAVERVGRES